MSDNLAKEQSKTRIAEDNLASACEKAREAVAANPEDERAALHLREVVERFAQAEPHEPREMPEFAPAVVEAGRLLAAGRLEQAEILLRQHLKMVRHDPPAMHLMAEIAAKCDLKEDAERVLHASAQIHAASPAAWTSLGMTMHRIACEKDYPDYVPRAVEALDRALALDPDNEPAQAYKASIFMQTRGLELARPALERLVSMSPQASMHWLNYAYLLKTVGEFGPSVAAYRTALALDRTNGTAWWGLANLKVARFFQSDIDIMESVLDDPHLSDDARVHISFTLAKALDETRQYERAARRLDEANKLRAASPTPESIIIGGGAEFVRSVFTTEFFERRRGWGEDRPDPIFILGMPRSGSTLVEQILASHSSIEGTEELFILHQLEGELGRQHYGKSPTELLCGLTEEDFRYLGARYIELAGRSRRTDRPLFTDKNPTNWRYLAPIHCMLPNAKIIDVRRNPMDCCFANYRQHYGAGANFAYDQRELGQYYADYVQTMRHFDEVLPGRVYRVIHDDLVDNFEQEVRRLLQHLGVSFEEGCLRFYETDRPIHTPSSEQVRQPINRSGFDRWRNYEPWLGELKEALGETLTNWR
jgi:tetratricopeptide (TPR) repeat protein